MLAPAGTGRRSGHTVATSAGLFIVLALGFQVGFGIAAFALRFRYASLWPAIAVHIIADYGIPRVYLDIA